MTVLDGSFKTLLGGVSQQIPRERLAGQLSVQENMLSDPVTGIRRRPGLRVENTIEAFNPTADNILSQFVEVGTAGYNVYVNSTSGTILVTDSNHVTVDTVQDDYLIAPDSSYLRETTASGYGWIANTYIQPSLGAVDSTKLNPVFDGWFFIRTGAFNKTYLVRFEYDTVALEYTYTTPPGANPTEVAASTPEGIALALYNLFIADSNFTTKFDVYRNGAYVYVTRRNKTSANTNITNVTSTSGQQFISFSAAMNVAQESDLPAKLPVEADGAVTSVGLSVQSRTYYRWIYNQSSWQETGSYDSAATLVDMPLRYSLAGDGTITISTSAFEGRLAGDDENNPYPHFIDLGISGISSFQGRLVILSGAFVALSGSNQPTRFLRSTVTELRDDDPIETGSGSATAARFEHAIQFNKDLILIANTHQAVMPTGSQALTPRNAVVVLTARQNVDTRAVPHVIGRTLMFGSPVSEDFFGVGELIPSSYSESQYFPQNLTDHIPRYMPGRCRQIVGSNTANVALFLSTQDHFGVLVHEYLWNGDERPLMSWHHWTFPTEVCSIHFARDIIVVSLKVNDDLMICTIDPKASAFLSSGESRPFLDAYSYVTVTDNTFTVPVNLRDVAKAGDLRLAQATGDLAGEPIGIKSVNTTTWVAETVRSFPSGQAAIGWKFTSAFAPTPPMMRDKNDVVISTTKTTILRYEVTVQKSGDFQIRVQNSELISDDTDSAITWSSEELGLGKAKVATFGSVVVPCRTIAHSTEVLLYTEGTRDLNVLDIEYTLRTVQRRQRL